MRSTVSKIAVLDVGTTRVRSAVFENGKRSDVLSAAMPPLQIDGDRVEQDLRAIDLAIAKVMPKGYDRLAVTTQRGTTIHEERGEEPQGEAQDESGATATTPARGTAKTGPVPDEPFPIGNTSLTPVKPNTAEFRPLSQKVLSYL